jgi:hypothetical protein
VSAEYDVRDQRFARLLQWVGFRLEGHRRAHRWIRGEWTDDLCSVSCPTGGKLYQSGSQCRIRTLNEKSHQIAQMIRQARSRGHVPDCIDPCGLVAPLRLMAR